MASAVTTAFVRLYHSGLIRRSTRLAHWCPALRSALSDMEVEAREIGPRTPLPVPGYERPVVFGVMYYIDYEMEHGGE
jgi:valyl-tRNA synthetase